jgi:cytochrome c553
MGAKRALSLAWLSFVVLSLGAECGCQANFLAASAHPRFAEVQTIIERRHLHSVAELLPLLPADYRAHYVLVFDSRSLQRATFEAPRVILFSEESAFVMSFNGSSDELGFESVETMEFDGNSKEFRFREIRFPDRPTDGVEISAINPSRCRACHGAPARPVWDTFPLWPGVYGERAGAPLSDRERRGLEAFARVRGSHPRYRYLVDRRDRRIDRDSRQYEGRHGDPNERRFDSLMSQWNLEAVLDDVIRAPLFSRYKYGLLEALAPACQERLEVSPAYARFAIAANRANDVQASTKRLRAIAPLDDWQWPLGRTTRAVPLNRFRFLVEEGLRLSTDQWSTALEQGTYDFAAPETDVAALFVDAAAGTAPDLSRLYQRTQLHEEACDALRRRHASQLGSDDDAAGSAQNAPDLRQKPAVLATCVECHEAEDVGPGLPFGNAAAFRRAVETSRYPRGSLLDEILFRLQPAAGSKRMPLTTVLSDEERTTIADYFRFTAGEMSDKAPLEQDDARP